MRWDEVKALRWIAVATVLVSVLTWSAWGRPALAEDNQVGGGDEYQVQVGEVEHVIHDVPPVVTVVPIQPVPVGPRPSEPIIQEGPDLVIDNVSIASGCVDTNTVDRSKLADGFQVNVTYRNAGTRAVTKDFDLVVTVQGITDQFEVIRVIHEVSPGLKVTNGTLFRDPGRLEAIVMVEVDAKEEVAELKESNNLATYWLKNPCVQVFPGGG